LPVCWEIAIFSKDQILDNNREGGYCLDKMSLLDTISVIGTVGTLAGLAYAILRVHLTGRAVDAVRKAVEAVRKRIQGNVLIADASTLTQYIEFVKEYIRNGEFRPALIRLGDVKGQLVRVCNITQADSIELSDIRSEMRRLFELEFKLDRTLSGTLTVPFDVATTCQELSRLQALLNQMIVKDMFSNRQR
jgi:hypothetical protein